MNIYPVNDILSIFFLHPITDTIGWMRLGHNYCSWRDNGDYIIFRWYIMTSMADRISDYAFGELGAEESKNIKEHLKTCHSCLDLYMDIKMAEEEAEQTKDETLEVLPGLQKAICVPQ